ncbi:hypothetical protein V8C42DRAFT_345000 [Trichoderma barbatum]
MSETKTSPSNRTFYLAIAFGIFGLFLLGIVPCIIAVFVARCREKRQERRDALARELEEGQGDDTSLPIPEDHVPVYRVDEIGEASGWQPDNDPGSSPLYQEATLLQHADGHVEVRKPEPTKGKGVASPQARPVGRFQEDLPEAPEQLDAVEESQDAVNKKN